MRDGVMIIVIAVVAAIASPIGGLIALWRKPTTLFMSMALGFAGGTLLATVSFEMLPQALELSSLPATIAGFVAGFLAVYGFDLYVYRGRLAGTASEQRPQVEKFYGRHRPRGGEVTVLAGGTSVEELIEGLSIGVGAAITPKLGLLVALAIIIDNLSESLSIGEIIRSETGSARRIAVQRTLSWTSLIGTALLVSALAGWFLLRELPGPALGGLFAAGAGGMFYLTVTDLVPQAEERHYQQSAGLATTAGFMVIFMISRLL